MLYVEPSAHEAPIIRAIKQADSFVDIEPYFIDDKEILSALSAARARGVHVRVIIEPHPYHMSARLVAQEIAALNEIGAEVQYAPSQYSNHWSLDHAKFLLTDKAGAVGTANLDYAAFHENREYIMVFGDPAPRRDLEEIFSADWYGRSIAAPPSLVVSPGSTKAMLMALDQPGPVYVESEEIGNDQTILGAMETKGAELSIIIPQTAIENDGAEVASLEHRDVQVHVMPVHPIYMHAKMIVGGSIAFIGSQNFSRPSLEENREVGLYLSPTKYGPLLESIFTADWTASDPAEVSNR